MNITATVNNGNPVTVTVSPTAAIGAELPRIEWYGGVADMDIDGDLHITGTDNTDALIACLTAHGQCHLQPGKAYAFRRGVDIAQIPQIASGEWQMLVTGGDGAQKADVGFLDGVLAPSTGATGTEIALPWWTSGTWSADYLFLGKNPSIKAPTIKGIRFYPNQKYRTTKFTDAGTYVRLGTVFCYLYGTEQVVEDFEIIRPGVNRGSAASMPETFVVGCTRNPSIAVSGEWGTTIGAFTFPIVGQTFTIDVISPFFDVDEVVYLQGLGFAKAVTITPDDGYSSVEFEVVEYGVSEGHYSRGPDTISVTLDTPIIRPGFGSDWTTHEGPKYRRGSFIGPVEPAPGDTNRGPELTLLLVDCPGYRRHLYRNTVVEDIHFENLLNSSTFSRAIHGSTIANTIGTKISNITAANYSGCLWYLDAWIALDMEVSGMRGSEVQAGIRANMGAYGFVGSEVPSGRADYLSPFRVSPWWQIRFRDCAHNMRQLWPSADEYHNVLSADSNAQRPSWGNVGHFDRLWWHDCRDSTVSDYPPIAMVFGDGYAFGRWRFNDNQMDFVTSDGVLVEGLRSVSALAAGIRYCRQIIWENNRTSEGEPVGVWHDYDGGGLVPEVLHGQTAGLSDNRSRVSAITPDDNGRVTLHLTATSTARIPLQRVTRWTGIATKMLLPRVSSSRRWFAGATLLVPNYPSEYHVPPGVEVTIQNDGTGTLTIEHWSKGDPNVETTITTIAVGSAKRFISANLADGHWITA